jgi:hypothetical protein
MDTKNKDNLKRARYATRVRYSLIAPLYLRSCLYNDFPGSCRNCIP